MFRLLAAQQADVIALQEVTPTFLMWLRDEAWVRDTYFLSDSVGTTLRGSFAYGVIFLVRRAASLRVDRGADFFGALANSSNVSVAAGGEGGAPRALGAAQVLKVWQATADFWGQQHHKARLFNTVREKRGGAKPSSNDQLLAELERDLADVLSQALSRHF